MRLGRFTSVLFPALCALSGSLVAQDEIADLSARGEGLFFERVSCWICHGENAEGLIGPSPQHGPTPMDIQVQLDANPQMAVIVSDLNPQAEDLVALATYIRDRFDNPVSQEEIAEMAAASVPETEFFLTERDRLVIQIQPFDTVRAGLRPGA